MTVRLDGVSFTYPGTADPALRDLSLTFESGQVTWLFGRLGAGASTLLLVSGGFAPALTGGTRQGSVRIDGAIPVTSPAGAALAGRIAYVSAQPHLQLSGLAETVFAEVAFAPANLGWGARADRGAVPRALARSTPDTWPGSGAQRTLAAGNCSGWCSPPCWCSPRCLAPGRAGLGARSRGAGRRLCPHR